MLPALSKTTPAFRRLLNGLPPGIQKAARKSFDYWKQDHNHPSVKFTRMRGCYGLYSARVNGYSHRALARHTLDGKGWLWFWIGTHAEYDALLPKLEITGLPPLEGCPESARHHRR